MWLDEVEVGKAGPRKGLASRSTTCMWWCNRRLARSLAWGSLVSLPLQSPWPLLGGNEKEKGTADFSMQHPGPLGRERVPCDLNLELLLPTSQIPFWSLALKNPSQAI